MKILVTGGYGFLGSILVERLLKEGYELTIIDNFSTGNLNNINGKIRTFNILTSSKNCEKIFKDTSFDVVVHLANRKLPKDNIEEFNSILHENNAGLINILYLSQKYKVGKFIMLSSYDIYGKQDVFPIKEEAKPYPLEEEGYHGLTRELYCDQYRRKGLNSVILRVGEVYGPRQNNQDSFIQKLLSISNVDKDLVLDIDNRKLDYIYVGDVVEAIKIVCEIHTPNELNISTGKGAGQQEILEIFSTYYDKFKDLATKETKSLDQDYILDNKKALYNLEWSPKYELLEGVLKYINWYENNKNITEKKLSRVKKKIRGQYKTRNNNYKDIENILLFILFAIVNYLLRYQLSIQIDMFLLYIVFVNLIYGFKQGGVAVVLSIIANIWFKLAFEDMKTFNLINDPSNILYSTMYFIIGISIGNSLDRIKSEKEIITEELKDVMEDMNFTYDIYEKSIEIKNALQNTIENYDDSFQKTIDVITKLEGVVGVEILRESRKLLSKVLQIKNIYIYSISADKTHIELITSPETSRFDSNMRIDKYEFLESVIDNQKIFINKSLDKSLPTIAAPLFQKNEVIALVLFDEIEFKFLNYQFMNTLKVLIYLISNRLSRTSEYIKIISSN